MRRRTAAVVLPLAVMLGALSVGGVASAATNSNSPAGHHHHHHHHKKHSEAALKKAGNHYLAIIGQFNSALTTFQNAIKAQGTTLTSTALGTAAAPVAQALQKVDQELSAYSWPKKARADITSLVQADGALLGDLSSAGTVNALTASSWIQQLARDESTAATDSGLVRGALKLPQASA